MFSRSGTLIVHRDVGWGREGVFCNLTEKGWSWEGGKFPKYATATTKKVARCYTQKG